MGDRGGTATGIWHAAEHDHFSRWEIGEEPQQAAAADDQRGHFSRWEIGEEPQLERSVNVQSVHFSRWEIGEEPQLMSSAVTGVGILADGRSGRNRNR